MRLQCIHCAATVAHLCPFCHRDLEKIEIDGRTWYRCTEQLTEIYFDPDHMPTRSGTCDTCAAQIINTVRQSATAATENGANLAQTLTPTKKGVPA